MQGPTPHAACGLSTPADPPHTFAEVAHRPPAQEVSIVHSARRLAGALLPVMLPMALLLAACGSGSPAASPTTALPATVASPTAEPAESAAATASAAASPEPAAVSTDGWQRVEIAEHAFAISIPPSWEVFDLTDEEVAQIIEQGSAEIDPALRAQIAQLTVSGGALFASETDQATLASGFAPNVNVIVSDGVRGTPLGILLGLSASFVEDTFGVTVTQERVDLPGGEAGVMTYEVDDPATGSFRVVQYAIIDDDRVFMITFSRGGDPTQDAFVGVFDSSIRSFEVLP